VLEGGRSIAVSGGEAPVMVRGNRGLLAMAITNLVDNARLHTPPGTGIEVVLDPAGGMSVIDDGPGITEDDAARLVRRFWRADHRRSDGAGWACPSSSASPMSIMAGWSSHPRRGRGLFHAECRAVRLL
jgi:signal transduction histidine kinase